jgi:hypothetical protein
MPPTETANAAAPQPISFAAVETAYCTCCEAQIPAQHIARNLVPVPKDQIAPPTRQKVRAWCEHCDRLYEVTRELSGGAWTLVSDIEVVTDPKRLKSFKARIALIKGDIQMARKR